MDLRGEKLKIKMKIAIKILSFAEKKECTIALFSILEMFSRDKIVMNRRCRKKYLCSPSSVNMKKIYMK